MAPLGDAANAPKRIAKKASFKLFAGASFQRKSFFALKTSEAAIKVGLKEIALW